LHELQYCLTPILTAVLCVFNDLPVKGNVCQCRSDQGIVERGAHRGGSCVDRCPVCKSLEGILIFNLLPFRIEGSLLLWTEWKLTRCVLHRKVVSTCVYRVTLHPYARYPGPFLAKFTNAYAAYHSWKGDLHIDIWRCHERYGTMSNYTLCASSEG
jgi:hypothetical protein